MRARKCDGLPVAMLVVMCTAALGGCAGAAFVADMLPMAPDVANLVGGSTPPPAESSFKNSNPLVVSRGRAASVKTIAVGPPLEKASPKEAVYLTEGVAKSGRFKVISPAALAEVAAKSGADLSLMTGGEKIEFLRKAARTLGADALMVLSGEEVHNQYSLGSLLLARASTEGENRLRVYATDTGELMWEQVESVKVTVGAYKAPESEEAQIRTQLDPLIANFVKTFAPASSEQLGSPDGHQG